MSPRLALLLALVACNGTDDTDDDGSVLEWCDVMDDGACINLIWGLHASEFPGMCDDAEGTHHTTGECPRSEAVGCCETPSFEYLYYGNHSEDLSVLESQCTTTGGTWSDCS